MREASARPSKPTVLDKSLYKTQCYGRMEQVYHANREKGCDAFSWQVSCVTRMHLNRSIQDILQTAVNESLRLDHILDVDAV